MLTRKHYAVAIASAGFQGFNPLSDAQKAKLWEDAQAKAYDIDYGLTEALCNTAQRAKFQNATIVQRTDEDAGNGQAVTYDDISTETDVLIYIPFDAEELSSTTDEILAAEEETIFPMSCVKTKLGDLMWGDIG